MDLKDQLTKALTAFNEAQGKPSYDGLSDYLADRLTIHRVDDLTPIHGLKNEVLAAFKKSSNGCQDCPCFEFNQATLTVSKRDPNVVTVEGKYYDNQADYAAKKPIPIACSYHFTAEGKIDDALPVKV